MRLITKRYLIAFIGGVCSILGASVALASTHGPAHHGSHKDGGLTHLAVLHSLSAKDSAVQAHRVVPSSAVLASDVGENKVYVYQRVVHLTPQICMADEFTKATAIACSPAEDAEREGVILIMPNLGSSPSIAVLVPNGVSSVTFGRQDNTSTSSPVVNNVAVTEDPTITAIHYRMPTGIEKSVVIEK